VSVVVDVRDLLGQPGASRPVVIEERIGGLATELAAVPDDAPVDAELLLENVVEGILVTGPVWGTMTLRCARCLKPFQTPFRVTVQELFTPDATPADDAYRLGEGTADLEPMLRDAILLGMPFAPLCREDCLGLCERCGGDRNLGECTCQPEADPRWAPLASLHLDLSTE